MSTKIKLALHSTYVHPDGRTFIKGVIYEPEDTDAKELLSRTDDRGAPIFARDKKVDAKEAKASTEEVTVKTAPPAPPTGSVGDTDKEDAENTNITITHENPQDGDNTGGDNLDDLGDTHSQGDGTGEESGNQGGDDSGKSDGDKDEQPADTKSEEAKPAAAEAPPVKKGGVKIVHKSKEGEIDTAGGTNEPKVSV